MKPILYILISLLLFSCSEKPEAVEFVPEKFQIDTITVELNYTPRDIIQYQDGFLCRISPYHNDSLQLVYMNDKFEIDDKITKELNHGLGNNTEAIWSTGDTLFAICGLRNYDLRYRIDKSWIVLDTGSTNKQNYMHHEKNLPIYEDSEFLVNSCCRGEFGGAIFFYDKKSKKTYSCPATCLSGIQKFNNAFYISSSLYTTSIIKIDDPRSLYEIKDENQLADCSWYNIYSAKSNDVEIRHPNGYDKGMETILDTFDISILGTFELKNHLYWIYSDTKSAYVGYIKDKRFEAIEKIYDKRMYLNEIRDLKHNSNILPIRSREMKGVIILAGNKIRIVEFKSNTTTTL